MLVSNAVYHVRMYCMMLKGHPALLGYCACFAFMLVALDLPVVLAKSLLGLHWSGLGAYIPGHCIFYA